MDRLIDPSGYTRGIVWYESSFWMGLVDRRGAHWFELAHWANRRKLMAEVKRLAMEGRS